MKSGLVLGIVLSLQLASAPLLASAAPPKPRSMPAAPSGDAVSALSDNFSIAEGNQINYFAYHGRASCHVIITNATDPRVIVAYPNQNSGTGVWFDPSRPENKGLQLTAASPPQAFFTEHGEGVHVEIRTNKPVIVLTEAILDSIRVLRAQAHEGGRPLGAGEWRALRERFAATHEVPKAWVREHLEAVPAKAAPMLVIERAELNGGSYKVIMQFPAGTTLAVAHGEARISAPAGQNVSFALNSGIPFTPMHPFSAEQLLRPEVLAMVRDVHRAALTPNAPVTTVQQDEQLQAALRALLFLSRQEKFMAGSWRFLTYFGRDTEISAMLLRHVLSSKAYRDAIVSVLDRLDPAGNVAHEEEVGSFAELRHAQHALETVAPPGTEGGDLSWMLRPLYDYKMVDDDFLLPTMAARYLTDGREPLAERQAFLKQPTADGRTVLQKLLINWDYVLGKANRLAQADNYKSLVEINPDQVVGDWRDSDVGLAGGRFPGDVNGDLVEESLHAIAATLGSGLVTSKDLQRESAALRLSNLSAPAPQLAEVWTQARRYFTVSLSADEVRQRLRAFVEAPNSPLSASEKAWCLAQDIGGGNLQAFLAGGTPPASLRDPLRFWAVSLSADGKPLPVMNSDFCFRLFLGEPSPAEVSDMLRLIELPYPLGLRTPVGTVVANAAYLTDPSWWRKLDKNAYHGAVMWSWQSSMLEMGCMRQLERFRASGDAALVARLQHAVDLLAAARMSAGPLAHSELWTWQVVAGSPPQDPRLQALAFGQSASAETESNAVQLWSAVYPAILLEHQRSAR